MTLTLTCDSFDRIVVSVVHDLWLLQCHSSDEQKRYKTNTRLRQFIKECIQNIDSAGSFAGVALTRVRWFK